MLFKIGKCFLVVLLILSISNVHGIGDDKDKKDAGGEVSDEQKAKFDDDGQITDENLPYAKEQLKDQTGVKDVNLRAGDTWDGQNLHTTINGKDAEIPLNDFSGSNVEISDDGVMVDGDKWEGISKISKEGERTKTPYADYSNYNNNEFWEVDDASFFPGGFDIGHASKIKTGKFSLENAHGAKKINKSLVLDSAGKFELEGAAKVKAGDAEFSDIGQSVVYMDDGLKFANVVSAKDNNTFTIANNTNITIDKGDFVKIKRNDTTGKYDVEINSDNGTIQDTGNVACADISPGSRYRYVGNEQADFGVYIPSDATKFNLCMRTEAEEQYRTNCSQCGVMDFYNQSFVLNGNYEYERKDAVDPRLFTDVIKANGNFSGNLSENAEDITHL